MGATVVDITRDGREGSLRCDPLSRRIELELTDVYWVETTSGADNDQIDVMQANGLPRPGDPHPRVAGLIVTGITPSQVSGRTDRWRVAVHYEMEFHEEPDVDVDFELHRVPVEGATAVNRVALNQPSAADGGGGPVQFAQNMLQWGTPVLNSAEEAFVPVPEDEEAYPVLRISRNELIFNLTDVWDYTNTLNKNPWLGKGPLQWWMMRRARPIPNSRAKWWRMDYLIKYSKVGWDLKLLDQGRYYRATPGIPPNGAMIPFKNDEGDNILGNLDGRGGALAAGVGPTWLHFRRKEVVDWGVLQLEATIEAFYSQKVEIENPGDLGDRALARMRKEAANIGL